MSVCFVGNISSRDDERYLEKVFRKYGKIKDIRVKRGYAFVEYYDRRAGDDAVYDLEYDRDWTVEIAKSRPTRAKCFKCGSTRHLSRDCRESYRSRSRSRNRSYLKNRSRSKSADRSRSRSNDKHESNRSRSKSADRSRSRSASRSNDKHESKS